MTTAFSVRIGPARDRLQRLPRPAHSLCVDLCRHTQKNERDRKSLRFSVSGFPPRTIGREPRFSAFFSLCRLRSAAPKLKISYSTNRKREREREEARHSDLFLWDFNSPARIPKRIWKFAVRSGTRDVCDSNDPPRPSFSCLKASTSRQKAKSQKFSIRFNRKDLVRRDRNRVSIMGRRGGGTRIRMDSSLATNHEIIN